MSPSSDVAGPIRTCVGCRAQRPQRELLRCVLAPDGAASIDRHGAGRGAWLCGPDCFEVARRRRAFRRAWRTDVSDVQLDALAEALGAEVRNPVRD